MCDIQLALTILLVIVLIYLIWNLNKPQVAAFTNPVLGLSTSDALLNNRAEYYDRRGWGLSPGREGMWGTNEQPAFWDPNVYTTSFKDWSIKEDKPEIAQQNLQAKLQTLPPPAKVNAGAAPAGIYVSARPQNVAATGNQSAMQQREKFGDDGSFNQLDLMQINRGN